MEKLILKYQTLTPEVQREVTDFVDFLSSKPKGNRLSALKSWKKKILNVSVWSAKDVKILKQNSEGLNSWQPQKW